MLWNHGIWIDFSYELGIIIPTDELIFFRRGRYTTNQLWHWFKKAPGTIVLCIINHSYWSYKSTFARKSVWKAWNGRSTQSLRSISELEAQHLPGRSASKKKGDPMGYPLGYPPNVIFWKDLWKNTEKWSGWWFQTWFLLFHFIYGMSSETHWWTQSFFKMVKLHHQPVMVTIKSLR